MLVLTGDNYYTVMGKVVHLLAHTGTYPSNITLTLQMVYINLANYGLEYSNGLWSIRVLFLVGFFVIYLHRQINSLYINCVRFLVKIISKGWRYEQTEISKRTLPCLHT